MKALTSMMPSKMSFFQNFLDLIVSADSTAKNLNSVFIVMDHIDTDLSKILKLGSSYKIDKFRVRNSSQNMLRFEYGYSLLFEPY